MTDQRNDYEQGVDELRRQFDAGVDARAVDDVQRRLRVAMAERAPSRRPLFMGLGFAGVVAAVAIAVVLMRPREVAHERPPVARVALVMRDATSAVGAPGALTAGSRLDVSKGGRVDLAVGNDARIAVPGPATIAVDADGQVAIADGVAAVRVAKQAPGRQFALRVGNATVIVHGTAFVVDAQDSALHGVSVSEGRVEIRPTSGAATFLDAGEGWGEARAAFTSDPFDAPWWTTMSAGTVVIDMTPPPPPTPPPADGAPRAMEKPDPPRAPSRPIGNLLALAEKAAKRGQCAVAATHVARFVESSKDDDDSARALMLEADCWLHGSEKARALGPLDRVANGFSKTARAASALFEASKLRSDLRMTKDASAGFAAYLERYPTGPLAESASFRHCELLESKATSACLETHLTRFASGRRVGDALLMLGSSACEHETWADAERAYWRYIEAIPANRDDVRNLRALLGCLERGRVPSFDKARATFDARHPAPTQ